MRFVIEACVAALESLIYPDDLAIRDSFEQVGDGRHASGPTADDNGLGLIWFRLRVGRCARECALKHRRWCSRGRVARIIAG